MAAFVLVYRALTGPFERNVWCVFLICDFQHSFAEQPIASMLISVVLAPVSYYAINQAIIIVHTWNRRQRPFNFGDLAESRARALADSH